MTMAMTMTMTMAMGMTMGRGRGRGRGSGSGRSRSRSRKFQKWAAPATLTLPKYSKFCALHLVLFFITHPTTRKENHN